MLHLYSFLKYMYILYMNKQHLHIIYVEVIKQIIIGITGANDTFKCFVVLINYLLFSKTFWLSPNNLRLNEN